MQCALLMRANKPETAVQSSAPFSLGTTQTICHVPYSQISTSYIFKVLDVLARSLIPRPSLSALNSGVQRSYTKIVRGERGPGNKANPHTDNFS